MLDYNAKNDVNFFSFPFNMSFQFFLENIFYFDSLIVNPYNIISFYFSLDYINLSNL